MSTLTTAATNFYAAEAIEVYAAENFDFTVVESAEPLPSLQLALRSSFSRVLATVVAAAAVTGILTIPPGGNLPFGASEPSAVTQNRPRAPDVITMTAHMRERAALASRLFQRTPHPGADDVEPDYGL